MPARALPIHSGETAPPAFSGSLAAARDAFGVVPNVVAEPAESPAAVEAEMTLNGILARSGLDRVEQQVAILAISSENGCEYCVSAHSTVAGMVRMPAEALAALRDGGDPADPRHAAVARPARAPVIERGRVDRAVVDEFLAAGFTPGNVLDIVLALGFTTLSNDTNHLADTPLDDAFAGTRRATPATAA